MWLSEMSFPEARTEKHCIGCTDRKVWVSSTATGSLPRLSDKIDRDTEVLQFIFSVSWSKMHKCWLLNTTLSTLRVAWRACVSPLHFLETTSARLHKVWYNIIEQRVVAQSTCTQAENSIHYLQSSTIRAACSFHLQYRFQSVNTGKVMMQSQRLENDPWANVNASINNPSQNDNKPAVSRMDISFLLWTKNKPEWEHLSTYSCMSNASDIEETEWEPMSSQSLSSSTSKPRVRIQLPPILSPRESEQQRFPRDQTIVQQLLSGFTTLQREGEDSSQRAAYPNSVDRQMQHLLRMSNSRQHPRRARLPTTRCGCGFPGIPHNRPGTGTQSLSIPLQALAPQYIRSQFIAARDPSMHFDVPHSAISACWIKAIGIKLIHSRKLTDEVPERRLPRLMDPMLSLYLGKFLGDKPLFQGLSSRYYRDSCVAMRRAWGVRTRVF